MMTHVVNIGARTGKGRSVIRDLRRFDRAIDVIEIYNISLDELENNPDDYTDFEHEVIRALLGEVEDNDDNE